MLRRDIDRCRFRSQMVLLGLAFLLGSVLWGCNGGSASDFAKKQQAQENAATALSDLGAKVTKVDKDDMKGWSVDLNRVPFAPKIAEQLKIMGSIKVLDLEKTSIDDRQLADLINQMVPSAVVELDLSHNPAITDQSVENLERLPFLNDLNLTGTQVTEAGIARLQGRRSPFNIESANMNKEPKGKMFNRSIPQALKRALKIRH